MSEQINIQQIMQDSSQDAVSFAKERYNYDLDFSDSSVTLVNNIISGIDAISIDDKELFTLSYIFGAYVGEVFIKQVGGAWLFQEETEDEPPQTFVKINENTIAFPSKVYHLLIGTEDQALDEYFAELVVSHKEISTQ
ncbi:hypothetical protein OAG1_16230 [Agarivorans sp. OAG1]|uniref:hypothetical protein n=1 Tax=unclassified Agarivorans TaxID=2636026 RepID=UPI002B2A7ADA|nr:hypothetical protein OAG1_16230 [Agarivorans sp. OAG1]